MPEFINQMMNLLLVVLIFSVLLGVVFYTFSHINRDDQSNFNAISNLVILLVVSFLLGLVYYYLSFPFNSLYLLNGILVQMLFYERFVKVFAFKKHLAYILIAILYFGSISVSLLVEGVMNGLDLNLLLIGLPNILIMYWSAVRTNTNDHLDFVMKLFGLIIAMRGV